MKADKPQLFLLHFAGGNIYSFRAMIPLLTAFDVVPLELPGRGKRSSSPLLYDFKSAVTDIYEQICAGRNSARFAIFGHSLGAYLALAVTQLLEKHLQPPAFLFTSGNAGPGIRNNTDWHLLDDRDFIEKLTALGGIPPEFLEDEDLMNYYLPILRADFELAEKSTFDPFVTHVPIYAMMGSQEENTGNIGNWQRFTHASFRYSLFEGGHFFIHTHPEKIAAIINTYCNSITSAVK